METKERIRVGVSTCLLGEKVRFDAGHKRDRFLTDVLGEYFEWVPVCPEVEAGMGVPREAVRLVGTEEHPRMVGVKTGNDWTDRMRSFASRRVHQLENFRLSGYIFKSDSPSCGVERVRIYTEKGMPSKKGRGIFADKFIRAFTSLPVEEEGRLNDARLRENFIVRVFSYHRLQSLLSRRFTLGQLVKFHTTHKYLMLAHSPTHYDRLGRFVANAKRMSTDEIRDAYIPLFMEGLSVLSTPKKNTNVLQHIVGFLRNHLGADEKTELLGTVDDYRRELVPLIVPITLIKHYVSKYRVEYILDQVYLNPHPRELMLRNHV